MNKQVAKLTAQQGDVLMKKLTAMPTGEMKVISKNKAVLAEGETTGHFHGVESAGCMLLEAEDGTRVLDLKETATVTHQEHGNITLDAGLWQVGIVNEYDYFSQMKKKVVD